MFEGKSLSSELYVWFKSQDFEMTLGSCKLKLWEAAVQTGKSILPCYMYWKNNTEKPLMKGLMVSALVTTCAQELAQARAVGRWWRHLCRAQTRSVTGLQMEKSFCLHTWTQWGPHRCCWSTKHTSFTCQWRIVWVCPGTKPNTVLYQQQLLVAACWHSAGVKNLSSYFHSSFLSHGWVPALFMLNRTMG